jgi:hypothetical protein
MGRGVEISEIAVADIDRADAEARLAGIEAVEIRTLTAPTLRRDSPELRRSKSTSRSSVSLSGATS